MRARLLTVCFAIALALAPALADARPGLGGSMGSRGSHTWSSAPGTSTAPGGGMGMERSYTPNAGSYGSSYGGGYGRGYGGYGMGSRGYFASGLLGGLVGAGIGGMLFGHGFFGGGMGSGFGFLGFLLQMMLIFFLGRYILRNLLGRPAMAGAGPGFFGRMMSQGAAGPRAMPFASTGSGGGGGPAGRPIAIAPADYQSFEQLLRNIQAAWTARDMAGLSQMATPEMVSYFGEQLAEQSSRGVRNQVTDVRLLQGDLSEAWSEGSRDYATVAMRFAMIDVTKDAAGRIVDGSPDERVTVTELWTFLRASGGRWVLSAIQQAR